MHSPRKWLTVSEVAEILGTSTETVRRMIKAAELPASRASDAPRAPWLIDAAEFERQRALEAERAAIRQRLAGVVVGRGEEFLEKVKQQHGPDVAGQVRDITARHDLFDRIEREMAQDNELQQRFAALDEEQRIEEAARELARRIRREEQVRRRALQILEEEDGDA